MCEIRWNPDAIVFNSWQHYGCPNYWMLHFFKESSGATLHPTAIQISNYDQLVASAITWQNAKDRSTYLRIKVTNLVLSTHAQSAPANTDSVKKKELTGMVAIHLQVVNFGNQAVDLNISIVELPTGIKKSGTKQTVLTSSSPLDENSFQQPEKVSAPTESVND